MSSFLAASQPASGLVAAADGSKSSGFSRSQAMQDVLEGDVLLHTLASDKTSMAHAEHRAVEVIDSLWDLDRARQQVEVLHTRLQRQEDEAAQMRHENAQLRACCSKVTSRL